MNKTKGQEELQTFRSNCTPKSRSLFQSKCSTPGGIDQMYVSVNKPQVPKRVDWSHLVSSTEQKIASQPPKRSTSSVEETKESVLKMKDDDEKSSTLKLRLEAMTWAAMAKDATILALQQRLKAVLVSLQNERDANAQLRKQLELSEKKVRQKQGSEKQTDRELQSSEDLSEQDRAGEATGLESEKQRYQSEFQAPLVLDSQQQRQASGFPV